MDEEKLKALPAAQKEVLLVKLLWDLKDARERLKLDSQTSSRPPRSDPPWQRPRQEGEGEEAEMAGPATEHGRATVEPASAGPVERDAPVAVADHQTASVLVPASKRPGRRVGAPGHSRSLTLPVSATVVHAPEYCVVCGQILDPTTFMARTGLYVLDVEAAAPGEGLPGLRVRHDKHLYGEITCNCGHVNRRDPGRCPADPLWQVDLNEWHLVGPLLVSLIVCLAQRMRLSRQRIQQFLHDWLELDLSTSTLNQCLHEAGRAVEPLEDGLVATLREATLAYADETPWPQQGQSLWLWVITSATVCLYFIGYRSKEILANTLGDTFAGWLMSDGYQAYRGFQQRLRCWAHLLRKAQGLIVSLQAEARAFGQTTHALLSDLMQAVYQAREGPPRDLTPQFQDRLAAFRTVCEQHRYTAHEKTRALAREFLNDWEAIWAVLADPSLPLTNNEAERALRHWVIARYLSHGTRTEQGSRAFALLASVIDTCRQRHLLPWPYLAQVIAERRKGNSVPILPAAA